MSTRQRTLPVKHLREQCRTLEQGIRARKLASDDEINALKPGGSENQNSGPTGWLFCYGQLQRLHARGEAVVAASRSLQDAAVGDAQGLKLFANEPQAVRCTALPGELAKVYNVHPKSIGALVVCHERDEMLQWLALSADMVRLRGGPEDLDLLRRADEEMVKHLALLCWVITTPGPGVPWDRAEAVPEPPAEFRQLDLADLLALQHAHLTVNGLRIEMVRQSVLGRSTSEAPAGAAMLRWTTFVGHAAMKLHRRPEELMWDWTLAELLMAVASSVEVEREAHERAKRDAGSDHG